MGFASPSIPATPPAPPLAAPATLANPAVAQAGANKKNAAAGAAMANGTNPTGAQGLSTPPSTAKASLLGGTSTNQ